MKINILLPYYTNNPGGGIKVMYEYGKRLANKGHNVVVYHCLQMPYTKCTNKSKVGMWLKFVRHFITFRVFRKPKWYSLPKQVKCYEIPYISNYTVRDADICFSTWWATAFEMHKLSIDKGKKVNLIQDYEINMTIFKDLVHESYNLDIEHIVIAPYLKSLLQNKASKDVPLIINGVDTSFYSIRKPIENRNPYSIIMLYAKDERKGSQYGLSAIEHLHEKYPEIQVTLFSSVDAGDNVPDWIQFYKQPNNLVDLYNEASIFISPSLQEGCALPPMEAMACGCACVLTNIGGHSSYAINDDTALLFEPCDVYNMVNAIEKLLLDTDHRISLAKRSNRYISQFDWNCSVNELLTVFNK
jgi:glycosyltransferase involved in cell wall biosynthesis